MEKNISQNYNLHISNILIKKNTLLEENVHTVSRKVIRPVDIKTRVKYYNENEQVGVVFNIKFFDDKQRKRLIGEFEYEILFHIDNFKNIPKIKNRYKLDENILAKLIDISISTMRGLLFSNTNHTTLHNFLLGIINPLDVLKIIKNQSSTRTKHSTVKTATK